MTSNEHAAPPQMLEAVQVTMFVPAGNGCGEVITVAPSLHSTAGVGMPVADVLTVSVATAEVVTPQVLENTARYWLLLSDALAVKLNGLLVAPGIFVNPLPLLACHCNVGDGGPLAAAVSDTTVPVQALVL